MMRCLEMLQPSCDHKGSGQCAKDGKGDSQKESMFLVMCVTKLMAPETVLPLEFLVCGIANVLGLNLSCVGFLY